MRFSLVHFSGIIFVSIGYICLVGNAAETQCSNFSIVGGQVYTPGLAIIDSPQPCTPEGGDFLQVAIDVSGDGHLQWPESSSSNVTNLETHFFSITIFLASYSENKNFTISNNTDASAPLGNILTQEPGSTVCHVNWLWPDCLVGNGQNPNNNGNNARGEYNISIHQNFRLNGTNYYTIFDLPISVTNDIPQEPSSQADSSNPIPGPAGPNDSRIACALLENPVQPYTEQVNSQHTPSVQPYLGGPVVVSGTGTGGSSSSGEIGNTANSDHPSFFGVVLLFVFLLTVVNL